jgi:hypothetical protein
MTSEVFLVFLGAIIGWLASSITSRLSENANLIDDHIRDMENFADIVEDYWLSEYATLNEELTAAARVKGRHMALTRFYGMAEQRLPLGHLWDYQKFQVRLYMTGLGGDFETSGRRASPNVAIDCVDLVSQIVQILRTARRDQLSVLWQCKQWLFPPFRKSRS